MKKILLITNDMDTISLLSTWLEGKGYQVKNTLNDEEALELLEDFVPHIVMVDVVHHQLILKIKENITGTKVALLILTGYTGEENEPGEKSNDYIEKPFDLPLLQQKIDQILSKT